MGQVIVQQPDSDLYAVFSSVVDDWTIYDATWDEVVGHFVAQAVTRELARLRRERKRVDAHGTSSMRGYDLQTLEEIRRRHGDTPPPWETPD